MSTEQLILISGTSATGKSRSLKNLKNQPGVLYLNCESGKRLPFKNQFNAHIITDPMQIYQGFSHAIGDPSIHTIVVDTATFMMNMYETQYVKTSTNTQQAWGQYFDFFQTLMNSYVAEAMKAGKRVVILAHTAVVENSELVSEVCVKVKGSLMNTGIESFFANVISTKKVSLKELEQYQNDLLTITEDDEAVGYKHVFQTRLTKATVNERIRGPEDMWARNETYIDNDVEAVLNRLDTYYS